MKVQVEDKQYARFGDGFVVRDVADDGEVGDWQDIEVDDIGVEVMATILAEEKLRDKRREQGPRQWGLIIERSAENRARAEELGFTGQEYAAVYQRTDPADTLASRLTDHGKEGTNTRVSEKRFDELHREMGLDPQEARARYRGEVD